MDNAIDLVKPGVTTADIVSVWPKAEEFGFPDEMAANLFAARVLRSPRSDRGGNGLRPRDLLAGEGRLGRGED